MSAAVTRARRKPQSMAMTDEEYDAHIRAVVGGMRPIDAEEGARLRRLLVPARVTGGDSR